MSCECPLYLILDIIFPSFHIRQVNILSLVGKYVGVRVCASVWWKVGEVGVLRNRFFHASLLLLRGRKELALPRISLSPFKDASLWIAGFLSSALLIFYKCCHCHSLPFSFVPAFCIHLHTAYRDYLKSLNQMWYS